MLLICEFLYLTCFLLFFWFIFDAIGDETQSMWGRGFGGDDMKTELA